MVAGAHPDEIDLFDYVEEDLPQPRRAEIDAHLASCAVCSEQVQRVTVGRDALREAQFMHLPERRGEAIFMNLPTQRREPGRSRALTPKQLIAVLTPVLAVVAVVAVLTNSGSDSSQSGEAAGGGAASATGTRSPPGAEADRAPVFSAVGPAVDVASELRSKGFRASLQDDRVVVKGATQREVRRALADRGPGDVEIIVTPR
jgi:anti-sigma factor RsiW